MGGQQDVSVSPLGTNWVIELIGTSLGLGLRGLGTLRLDNKKKKNTYLELVGLLRGGEKEIAREVMHGEVADKEAGAVRLDDVTEVLFTPS